MLGVDGPYQEPAGELAEKFYEEKNLPYFAAVMKSVNLETRELMMERSYKDDRIDYFSIAADEESEISEDKIEEAAEKAVSDRLSESKVREFAQRAVKDQKYEYLYALE